MGSILNYNQKEMDAFNMEHDMMKINTRVETKLGTGTVVGYDKTCERLPRYGVQLDNNVFGWKINCYYFFTDEVKRVKDNNKFQEIKTNE